METRSIVRGVRLSADKGRLVADMVRGKKVDQALNILTFTPKKAAGIIKKALESAIANADHNDGADIDEAHRRFAGRQAGGLYHVRDAWTERDLAGSVSIPAGAGRTRAGATPPP